MPQPVEDYGALVALLAERRPGLSKRLRQVARFVVDNPEDVAIHSIVELARKAEVQPSTITRFAKELGFEGFAELQGVFRQRLVGPRMSYEERMAALAARPANAGDLALDDPLVVFDSLTQAAMDALLRLREDVRTAPLGPFIDALHGAEAVHVAAARGAFGVGSYCYYGLGRAGKRAFLLDNLGAMREQQMLAIGERDALLAISFDDYTPETLEAARDAARRGRTVLVITDNALSPFVPLATHALFVKEARLGHFRSQVPAMVLCQSLIASLGRLMAG
ncbi:MurR/RpiR family transcriptional regulator [Arsenicitalea aurantiaca]|uniref:MurR/RpiR family transcriptional regulator n=1 Tax=Arsenicitalea aurantiaca TaxID=1783274 RepID=A0A433XL96_9HYPH|nr:MurR/RpiR family transcriptional regulator [Arsenicitalea aurantiaca]RUT34856.1 MurR/RpiR family transcriptional regulator [Arsenicitalea aurantiaca]